MAAIAASGTLGEGKFLSGAALGAPVSLRSARSSAASNRPARASPSAAQRRPLDLSIPISLIPAILVALPSGRRHRSGIAPCCPRTQRRRSGFIRCGV